LGVRKLLFRYYNTTITESPLKKGYLTIEIHQIILLADQEEEMRLA